MFSCLFFRDTRFYTSCNFLLLVTENSIELVRFLCLCCISRIFDLFGLKYPKYSDLFHLCIGFIDSQVQINTTFPIAAAIPYIFVYLLLLSTASSLFFVRKVNFSFFLRQVTPLMFEFPIVDIIVKVKEMKLSMLLKQLNSKVQNYSKHFYNSNVPLRPCLPIL